MDRVLVLLAYAADGCLPVHCGRRMTLAYDTALMDGAAPNSVGERICNKCGTLADEGLIFCATCGTALRKPAPLITPGSNTSSQLRAEAKPKRTLVKWSLIAVCTDVRLFCMAMWGWDEHWCTAF